jgi:hypothetical protein
MFQLILAISLLFVDTSVAVEKPLILMNAIPSSFKAPDPEDQYDVQLLDNINNLGWYNIHIEEENNAPAYAFSIGHFHKQNHPEIIVIGLKLEVANKLLNVVALNIIDGDEIEPFKKYESFIDELTVSFVPIDIEFYGEYLGYANWYYEKLSKPYPVLQMVWPDKKGIYPWEDGYDDNFLEIQPILVNSSK